MGKKGAVAAPRAAPVASSTCDSSWLNTLTAEDRRLALNTSCTNATALELEKKKQEERDKKANEHHQKQLWENEKKRQKEDEQRKVLLAKKREETKWEKQVDAAKQRAFKEGVLEAILYDDGKYWVELEVPGKKNKVWQEVQGQYYCTLCDKHPNETSLAAHLESDAHKRKVAWNVPGSASAPTALTTTPSSASAPRTSTATAGGAVEAWQQRCSDGTVRCLPCKKVIDNCHLGTPDHKRHLQDWQEQQDLARSGYAPPALEYLALVPWENDPKGARYPKCLLCDRWCQDETSHIGTPDDPSGSKDHERKLRNYSSYRQDVMTKRLQYHPQAPPTVSTVQPTRTLQAAPATPAPWALTMAAPAAPPAAPPAARPVATPARWPRGGAVTAQTAPSGLDQELEEC